MSKVKVIEKNTRDILFECEIDNAEKAYEFAKNMEEMGVDIELIIPSVTETLNETLGASQNDLDRIKQEMLDEIESHDCDSCSFTPNKLH